MKKFISNHPILWAYFYFCYFSLAIQLLIVGTGMAGFVGVRQSLLVSCIWLIPILLMPSKARVSSAIIGLALWSTSLAGLGYWLIYGQEFSQSAIFIIFESNSTESAEFVQSYLRWWHPLAFVLYSIPPFLMWREIKNITLQPTLRYGFTIVFGIIFSWSFIESFYHFRDTTEASDSFRNHLEPVSPWNLAVGYQKYSEQLADMNDLVSSNHALKPLEDFNINSAKSPDTVVLVIGESTNSQRMSLYGYPRKTTPRLDAMREDLVVFDNVITPRPYTIEALQQILSFSDNDNIDAFFQQPTLLNMMKQASYDTTWITNQQTQTKRNTLLTALSQLADHQIYLNNNRRQNASQYDESVLEPLVNALKSDHQKKFIVVHLLGTHRKYSYRYPSTFSIFNTRDDVPDWVSSNNLEQYNNYDNAVLYNDYVISEIVSELKNTGDRSLLVYFSDHGEEVYDYESNQFCGRNENSPTPAMYTVPFITWSSNNWVDSNGEKFDIKWSRLTNRPFLNTDFIHTLPDMIGISFSTLAKEKSLVSDKFLSRPRLIGNPNALTNYSTVEHKDLIVNVTVSTRDGLEDSS
jgi:heptose-I-phosphate ethanolaminephosphotransferase